MHVMFRIVLRRRPTDWAFWSEFKGFMFMNFDLTPTRHAQVSGGRLSLVYGERFVPRNSNLGANVPGTSSGRDQPAPCGVIPRDFTIWTGRKRHCMRCHKMRGGGHGDIVDC